MGGSGGWANVRAQCFYVVARGRRLLYSPPILTGHSRSQMAARFMQEWASSVLAETCTLLTTSMAGQHQPARLLDRRRDSVKKVYITVSDMGVQASAAVMVDASVQVSPLAMGDTPPTVAISTPTDTRTPGPVEPVAEVGRKRQQVGSDGEEEGASPGDAAPPDSKKQCLLTLTDSQASVPDEHGPGEDLIAG